MGERPGACRGARGRVLEERRGFLRKIYVKSRRCKRPPHQDTLLSSPSVFALFPNKPEGNVLRPSEGRERPLNLGSAGGLQDSSAGKAPVAKSEDSTLTASTTRFMNSGTTDLDSTLIPTSSCQISYPAPRCLGVSPSQPWPFGHSPTGPAGSVGTVASQPW